MDYEKSLQLTQYYREQPDEDIKEFLRLGRDSFEEGAYDILLMEAKIRKIDTVSADNSGSEKPLGELTRGEILALFMAAQTLEKNSYNALCAEAFQRNINRDEVERFYKDTMEARAKETGGEEATDIPALNNPLPLLTIDNPEDAQPFFTALIKTGIVFNVQIMVEEKDYERANYAISVIQTENKP